MTYDLQCHLILEVLRRISPDHPAHSGACLFNARQETLVERLDTSTPVIDKYTIRRCCRPLPTLRYIVEPISPCSGIKSTWLRPFKVPPITSQDMPPPYIINL